MPKYLAAQISLLMAGSLLLGSSAWAHDGVDNERIEALVNNTIVPLMAEHRIPGMSVALT